MRYLGSEIALSVGVKIETRIDRAALQVSTATARAGSIRGSKKLNHKNMIITNLEHTAKLVKRLLLFACASN